MINYETFREIVQQRIQEFMPEELENLELRFFERRKVNELLDAVCFENPNENIVVSPTIYINDMYERYKEIEDVDYVMKDTMEKLKAAFHHGMNLENVLEKNGFEQNIVFQLINTEQNREFLKDHPHRDFHDLSIIYRWVVENDKAGIASFIVQNDMAEEMGVKEEQLYEMAYENTKKLFPPTVRTMREVIAELMFGSDAPEDMVEMMFEDEPAEEKMYVMTNSQKINGAASMIYETELQELASKLGDNLFIMPSSVHELIIVKAGEWNAYELAAMVEEINMTQVELRDRLSNQVYCYDKDLGKLLLATDTPSRRLDGKVAEKSAVYDELERCR